MSSEDIRTLLTTTEPQAPEEAAKTISRAKVAGIPADTYKELKFELDPDMRAREVVPDKIEPLTLSWLKESETRVSLAQDDIAKLSNTEKRVRHLNNKLFKEPEIRREMNELSREQMYSMDGKLPQEKLERLQLLEEAHGEINLEDPGYDVGTVEEYATKVGSAVGDMVRAFTENKKLLATTVGVPAVTGASVGSVGTGFNPIGAAIGAKTGAITGLAASVAIVPAVDAFKETGASVYRELGKATRESLPLGIQGDYGGEIVADNQQNLNLSHERKAIVANGVALLSAGAAFAAGKVLAGNNPFIKKFMDPKYAARYVISNPALMAKLDVIGGIFKSAGAEGLEEGFQEAVEKIATEFGKMDGSQESFMNAVSNIFNAQTGKDILEATIVGAGAGGTVATAINLPQYQSVRKEYVTAQEVSRKKQEVLETQNTMMELTTELKDTKVQKLAPEELKEFKKKVVEQTGDEPVHFNVSDLQQFADNEAKGLKIRSLLELNPELVKLAKETNSTIPLSKADVLDVMTDFPEISDFMRLTPDGQNPLDVRNEAKIFGEKLTKLEEFQTFLGENLGLIEDVEGNKARIKEALGELNETPYFENEQDYLDNSIITPRDGEARCS
jgi:hypothetical protein